MKIPPEDLFSGPVYCIYDYLDDFVIAFASEDLATQYKQDRPEEVLYIRSIFVYTTTPPIAPPMEDPCEEFDCIKSQYGKHSHGPGCPNWPRKAQ